MKKKADLDNLDLYVKQKSFSNVVRLLLSLMTLALYSFQHELKDGRGGDYGFSCGNRTQVSWYLV